VYLDSDAVVKVEWLEVLRDLYRRLQEQHKPCRALVGEFQRSASIWTQCASISAV
jgi:hypothetical protein